ncbi:WD repeat-containing protein 6 [Sporothrix epigloea]|uniref:WD repeat-containing protein 6 n=1 Tax=Sporothrix epigloea TaxID=1892477 RepID=A0ABP0E3G9_9PEZI
MAATLGTVAPHPPPNGDRMALRRLQRTGVPVLCPVTALAFYQYCQTVPSEPSSRLLVLAGEDGWLSVYGAADDEDDSRVATRPSHSNDTLSGRHRYGHLRIFAEQPIQGLEVEDGNQDGKGGSNVLVWGGQSVTVVSRQHIIHLLERELGASAPCPILDEVVVSDWIYDGLLPRRPLRGDDVAMGALITAHNEVLPFRVDKDGETKLSRLTLVSTPISPSRPVLYSAQLAWAAKEDSDDDSLLVAAGTVFGEIVIWTCRLPVTSSRAPDIKVLDVFAGHEGSIFDVAVSPVLNMAVLVSDDAPAAPKRQNIRLLASCSDDRTIRLWPLYLDADDANKDRELAQGANTATEARETGFHNSFEGLAQRKDEPMKSNTTAFQRRTAIDKQYKQSTDSQLTAASSPSSAAIATVMAHASRIWNVRFGDVSPAAVRDGNLFLYSFGEDATAQEWRLELAVSQPLAEVLSQFVHLRTVSSHAGKNIWSAAVSAKTATRGPLIATGGCDGKICLFEGIQGQSQQCTAGERQVPLRLVSGTIACSTLPSISRVQDHKTSMQKADGNDVDAKPKKGSPKKAREMFNSYAFLSEDRLLAASTDGRLLVGNLRQTGYGTAALNWHELPDVPESITMSLKNYNVVRSPQGGSGDGVAAGLDTGGIAIIGNAAGQLFLCSRASGLQQLSAKLSGKVDDIYFLPPKTKTVSISLLQVCIFATTLFSEEAALIDLEIDLASGCLCSEYTRTLKLPTKVPGSPVAMVITAASRCLEYIVLGSRNGQLCLYKPLVGEDCSASPHTYELVTQLQTRTKDAILSIVPLPPRPGNPLLSSASFVVTARDGTYRIYCIDKTDVPTICLQHETATPFGPIVRGAWFVGGETPGEPAELVVCGFRSTNFVVWNESRQQELASVDCGGTHRTHTYLYTATGSKASSYAGKIRFAFTRQSELHVFAQDVCVTTPIKAGGHGREIRCIRSSSSGKYLATGGEDTVVRIWDSRPHPEQRCLSVLKLHNTGLHNLAWIGDNCLISAAGAEELFIWRITTIPDSSYDGLAVLCESSYPDSTNDKVLRIIGLDASLDRSDKKGVQDAILLSVGLSNSILKTYRYTLAGGWQLLAQCRYTGACLTQLRHLQSQQARYLAVLAAYTDGHLTVWKASPVVRNGAESLQYSDYSLVCATKAHQNAIKALDIVSTTVTGAASFSNLIFTGGDDNAIAVTALHETSGIGSSTFSFGNVSRVASAHAAAITGAKILFYETEESGVVGLTAVTCSNDQRVKSWRAIVSPENSTSPIRIQLLDDCYSAIADPSDVESIGDVGKASVVVVGMGMENWSLEEFRSI